MPQSIKEVVHVSWIEATFTFNHILTWSQLIYQSLVSIGAWL